MGIESLVFAVLASNAVTIGLAGSALAISVITSAVTIGLSVGLSLLSSALFRPKQPKPEDVQTSVKNPTAPRTRHYGRVKTSGPWVFGDSIQGELHRVIALGTGELDAIEEVWVDDNLATIDVNGGVTSNPYGANRLTILTRIGAASQTAYTQITAKFPEWTSAHTGNGISSLYAVQHSISTENFSKVFPNGINTTYRVVARGSKIFNSSTSLTEWSDNAAAIIRDYMTHSDGMRLPSSMFTTTQANAGWLAAYNRCAELIDKKAGGTEARWRLWGSYTFDERPADVVGRMLQCSDARIVPTPDGGVTLDIGTWAEPTVTIDADAIVGFSELARGHDILTTANVISATYLAPTHDFQATDADRWIDDADVSVRGEIVSDLTFNMAPSHGQARRLMKLAAYRANPSWVGSFQCNLRGLAAFGERFVRISYPLFGIDEVFELVDFRFDLGEGGILSTVTLQVQSMPEAAYDWDAATEEGDEPVSEDTVVDDTIPVPTGLAVTIQPVTIGGVTASRAVLVFDASPTEALILEGRGKLVTDSAWETIAIEPGATSAVGFIIDDIAQYEFTLRFVTQTGRVGDWVDPTIKVVASRSADFRYPSNSQYWAALAA
ncbi:fibronectin type III domain-containing protein [Mesorhizobium sp.]|uniref:fibronectin type III domain-containing protein n=1 Tax=Mesorhizobium sp. TaxID=1871066 RepID=UPI0025809E35|nr:fibronectin type III domain-containing protein [Mesorhizobium sp.]